jgi:hypothetical protein
MALVAFVAMTALYFYLGYLPLVVWVSGLALLLVLLFNLVRGHSDDPCIVLNPQGVFDRRLKVGVIQWADIRRIDSYSLHGAEYVCLYLHDVKTYDARRPLWLRLLSNVQRIFGMSTISISTNGLDIDRATLMQKIHEGCQAAGQQNLR